MLKLKQVSRLFGGLQALSDVNMTVPDNKIIGLIGPNGAGKTTLINIISGLDHPTSGSIEFGGQEIHRLPPHRITRLGIARTYQNIRLFGELTPLENLLIGQHGRGTSSVFDSMIFSGRFRREVRDQHEEAMTLLRRFNLEGVADTIAGTLPYGDQRRLEMARALSTHPRLVLLDEPTAGMNPIETHQLGEQIVRLRDDGLTALVIEHDMSLIHQVCDEVYVLSFGQIIAHGTPAEIRDNPLVIEAYLGQEEKMALLEVRDLHTSYGAIKALRGLSFQVESGQVVSLIGANGAGKSTTLNTVSGILKPVQGQISFAGADITEWRADRVTGAGLVQVPEGRQIVATMTVLENLMLGAYRRQDRDAVMNDLNAIFKRFPRMKERQHQKAGSLSGGEQQMLAVGRALMSRPRLLMLDEPSMGLAPLLVNEIFLIIAEIKAQGIPILLVEQNARKALQIADYAYVLERGKVAHEGIAANLREDKSIIASYLG